MPDYVTREEFEARVGVLEHEVEGEKMVTRHILEQTRHNGDDLAAIKTRLGRVETDVATLKTDMKDVKADLGIVKPDVASLKRDVGGMKAELRNLREDLPKIIGEVVREVFRERDGKR